MATTVLDMSVSVDGFVCGPDDRPGNPGGDGFLRLHDWAMADGGFRTDGVAAEVADWVRGTGAVVVGRRTAEQAGHWGGDHHGGVPVFVLSSRPPAPEAAALPLVTYVTDAEPAVARARAAAGDRDVLVHGAVTARRALAAGLLDELQLHHVPVLFGGGRRLFDVPPARTELDVVRVVDTPEATHVRYRVRR
ncbi:MULTISPECIES: dihydrofolate reductase family protein [unclassified Blastococcus]